MDAKEIEILRSESTLPRIAMISTHGYVAAVPPLGAADTGGQVVYVIELSKKLAQLGYEVDIWTRRFADQPEVEPVSDQVRVIRAGCGSSEFIPKEYLYLELEEWCSNAIQIIRERRLKYAFIDSHYWDAGVAGTILANLLGCPHVHTPHSLGIWKKRQMETDFPEDTSKFEKYYNFSKRIEQERLIYGKAEMVVATTPPQLDLLEGDYGVASDKCRIIPPGYDDNRFFAVSDSSRAAIRNQLGFSGKVVLAIGRLAQNKGYDLLIHAFQLVSQRDPEAVLHLAVGGQDLSPGEKRLLDSLKALTRQLGLQEKVQFAGFVPDESLPDYYRAADVFVLSSRYEPFGMTAIEAMACGTPTVVTVHGGLYRALTFGRHALYADPFDREDLGITIWKTLIHQRVRNQLSSMGAIKARSLFTWSGVAQQLISAVDSRPGSVFAAQRNAEDLWNEGD